MRRRKRNPFLRADIRRSRPLGMAGAPPARCSPKSACARTSSVVCAQISDAPARGHPPARALQAASRRRPLSRDVPRRAHRRRPRRFDGDLLPAGARRALALAPGRCGGGLALLRRRAAGLEMAPGEHGAVERMTLGPDLAAGERPQAVVPAGHWQAAKASATGRWSAARSRRDLISRASSWRRRTGSPARLLPGDHVLRGEHAAARDQHRRKHERRARGRIAGKHQIHGRESGAR